MASHKSAVSGQRASDVRLTLKQRDELLDYLLHRFQAQGCRRFQAVEWAVNMVAMFHVHIPPAVRVNG